MESERPEGGRLEVAAASETSAGLCSCSLWANFEFGQTILTGHHPNCPKSPTVMTATRELLTKLVRGIEYWASQEDGIPDEVWDAYAKAKAVIGEAA